MKITVSTFCFSLTKCLAFVIAMAFISFSCKKSDPPVPAKPERTVIVYMAAKNNLEEYAHANINQMEKGYKQGNGNGDVLVYLNDSKGLPRVIKIKSDTSSAIVSEAVLDYPAQNAVNSGVMKKVLGDIIEKYPAENYGLILWSHATSWMPPGTRPEVESFGYQGGAEMDIQDLKDALPLKFEYIAFDACSMAGVEVAYELRNKAEYILASPTETIASGMPYHLVVNHFLEGVPGLTKAASKFVDFYKQQAQEEYRSATISLINCSELEQLAAQTKALLESVELTATDYNREKVQRLDFDTPAASESYDFIDFLEENIDDGRLSSVKQQLQKTVVFKLRTDGFLGEPIEAFCGLSCYIPHEGESFINTYYKSLAWAQESGFSLLVVGD